MEAFGLKDIIIDRRLIFRLISIDLDSGFVKYKKSLRKIKKQRFNIQGA